MGVGEEGDYTPIATRMIPALRWAAVTALLTLPNALLVDWA